jgi:hypothetical protein
MYYYTIFILFWFKLNLSRGLFLNRPGSRSNQCCQLQSWPKSHKTCWEKLIYTNGFSKDLAVGKIIFFLQKCWHFIGWTKPWKIWPFIRVFWVNFLKKFSRRALRPPHRIFSGPPFELCARPKFRPPPWQHWAVQKKKFVIPLAGTPDWATRQRPAVAAKPVSSRSWKLRV